MDIGILTFYNSQDNYGQVLQCYALQKYLCTAGYNVKIIPYKGENDLCSGFFWRTAIKVFNPKHVLNYIKSKAKKVKKNILPGLDRDRKFDDFRKQFICSYPKEYFSYEELLRDPPEADAYIVGSDQVWSIGTVACNLRYSNVVNTYFLNFGKETTSRISYAASWGTDSIDKKSAKIMQPLLNQFDYVSVREKSGVELCRQCGYKKAEWVCDPTMLLAADEYRNLYKQSKIRKQERPFLLLYMLSNKNTFNIEKAYEFAAQKGLQVIYVTGNGLLDKCDKFYATIPEWLYLVDQAEYVITNSFHGCVFSSIFRTRYGVVRLCGKESSMNERLDSLFELYDMQERFITDEDMSALDMPVNIKREISAPLLEILDQIKG